LVPIIRSIGLGTGPSTPPRPRHRALYSFSINDGKSRKHVGNLYSRAPIIAARSLQCFEKQ